MDARFQFLGFLILVCLMVPAFWLFWLITTVSPEKPDVSVYEEELRESIAEPELAEDSMIALEMEVVQAVGPFPRAAPWLTAYPRKWVGVSGMIGVAIVVFVLGLALFWPRIIWTGGARKEFFPEDLPESAGEIRIDGKGEEFNHPP